MILHFVDIGKNVESHSFLWSLLYRSGIFCVLCLIIRS